MSVAIVTDSTCDLPAALAQARAIEVVPQHILWGTESYTDGIQLTVEQFYSRLEKEAELPKTSQPSPNEFADAYRRARDAAKAHSVVCITLSKLLSGTYNSAEAARALVDFPVRVVDSQSVTMGLGFAVLAAADARDRGASPEEMAQAAALTGQKSHTLFTVNTLEFLHRGGRIGGAQRLIGTALSIKPILEIRDGQVHAAENVRTRKRALARLIEIVCRQQSGPLQIAVLHGAAPEDAERVAADVQHSLAPKLLIRTTVCSAVGAHAGPGVVGLAFVDAE